MATCPMHGEAKPYVLPDHGLKEPGCECPTRSRRKREISDAIQKRDDESQTAFALRAVKTEFLSAAFAEARQQIRILATETEGLVTGNEANRVLVDIERKYLA